MNRKAYEIFNREVEEITTFVLVRTTKEGNNLLVNKKSLEVFLERSSTKQIIPLGVELHQLAGGTYIHLSDYPEYPL